MQLRPDEGQAIARVVTVHRLRGRAAGGEGWTDGRFPVVKTPSFAFGFRSGTEMLGVDSV